MSTEDAELGPLNDGCDHSGLVDPAGDGNVLVEHLARRFPRADAETWALRAANGELFVSGEPAGADRIVRAGQRVLWRRPPWREPLVPLGFAILWRDPEVLVVAKPRGLPTLPGGGLFDLHTVMRQVEKRIPGARPVHRLGRHTSGIVLCGRTRRARGVLSAGFRDGTTQKEYVALVEGHVPEGEHTIDVPLGPVPHPKLGTVTAHSPEGKPAFTTFERIESRGAESLVRVRIATGRPHQIRIHCAWLGHPLVGDPLYGIGGLPKSDALPSDGGYALHARRVVAPHPAGRKLITVECMPPPDLRSTRGT